MSILSLAITAALPAEPAAPETYRSEYRRSHTDESCIDWLAALPDGQAYIDRLDRGDLRALECELSGIGDFENAKFRTRYAIWAAGGERAEALVDYARERTRSDIAWQIRMAHSDYGFLPEIGTGPFGCIEGMPGKGRALMDLGRPDLRGQEAFHCGEPDPNRRAIERLAEWIILRLAPAAGPRDAASPPASDRTADAEPRSGG